MKRPVVCARTPNDVVVSGGDGGGSGACPLGFHAFRAACYKVEHDKRAYDDAVVRTRRNPRSGKIRVRNAILHFRCIARKPEASFSGPRKKTTTNSSSTSQS